MHAQLRIKIDYAIQNIKTACYKKIIVLNNLVELKRRRDLPIIKVLLSSDIKLLCNNYKNCANLIRAFLMCSWSSLALKGLLEITPADRDMCNPLITSKLMSCKEHVKMWKDLPKSGLKHLRKANFHVIRVPGIILF